MKCKGFPYGSVGKSPPVMEDTQEMGVRSLGQEDPLEEEMATHFSILAWEIPWTEEPGRQRVGHNLVTKHTSNHPMMLTVL